MGKLTILFKSGSKLIAADVGGTSDPYCTAKLKFWGTGEVKSKKAMKTLNPTWGDTHELVLKEKNDVLLINVWDWDRIGKDETLGFAEVEVNTLKQGANDLTLKLQEVKSGEISITITADLTGCGTKAQPTPSELGFEIIAPFNALAVRQRMEKAEMFSGNLLETENQYDVFDPVKYKGADKVQLFNLKEQSSAAARAGGVLEKTAADKIGSQSSIGRSGDMSVHCRSPVNKNLIHFTAVKMANKGTATQKLGNFLQGGMTWEVRQVPSNTIVGFVAAAGGEIAVLNDKQEVFYSISPDPEAAKKGIQGKLKAATGGDQKFFMQVVEDPKKPDKKKNVGYVMKKWGGLTKEALSDADNYHVEFPKDATPTVKVLSMYACLAVDYVHFEKGGLSTYVTVAETISTGGANLVVDVSMDYAKEAAMDYAMGEAQSAAIGAAAGKMSGSGPVKYADPKTMSSGNLTAASAAAAKDKKEKDKDKKDKDKDKDKGKDKDKKDKDKDKNKDKDKKKDKDKDKDKDKKKDKKK